MSVNRRARLTHSNAYYPELPECSQQPLPCKEPSLVRQLRIFVFLSEISFRRCWKVRRTPSLKKTHTHKETPHVNLDNLEWGGVIEEPLGPWISF